MEVETVANDTEIVEVVEETNEDEIDENGDDADISEVVYKVDEDEDDEDDEFDYDEDGNIIIPDVVEDEDDGEEVIDIDALQDADEEDTAPVDEEDKQDDKVEDVDETKDERDEKIRELERKLSILESQGKETLSKLGMNGSDLLTGLETLAAEAEDMSVDEYRQAKTEKDRIATAQELLQKTEFEKKAASDLLELQKYYPETASCQTIYQIENIAEFGRLRDLGLTPQQAYAAANPVAIRKQVAESVKQQSLNDTKKHLQSAVLKGGKDTSITMTRKELVEWRDLFPNKSDKEIISLYKESKSI